MYCNQCGTKLPDDAKFCSTCGKPTVDPIVETVAAVAEETQKAVKPVKEKKTVPKTNFGEKKLFGKLPLKWLLAILGGVVVLALATVLIFNIVEEKKSTTILGNIPDPEIFFGVTGKHNQNEYTCYSHNIEFETEDVTKDMVEAYTDLLGSSEYPFVMNNTLDFYSDGSDRYAFKYNGLQELYNAKPNQIVVEYNPGYERVVVYINNSGNFELVPVEPYNSDNVSYESTEPESFSEGSTMENDDSVESSFDDSTGGGYVDCSSCYGGNCTACNGSGGEYSYSPGLDREWESCWKCSGSGNCSSCSGSGQVFE